jgi:hypothetical protein
MARALDPSSLIPHIQNLLKGTGKNAVTRLWGEHGPEWGTSFADLEELAVQIAKVMAQEFLHEALQRQAQADPPAKALLCPTCGRLTEPAEEASEPRVVQTRAGDAEWAEPHRTCGRCRKAFFPSVEGPGH